jgi:hypothetical protein
MAKWAGLEVDGRVNVPKLARWAYHNEEWAEYLRSGDGSDEAWWLYRRLKEFPGYKVSGWHAVWEERARQAEGTREAELWLLEEFVARNKETKVIGNK